MINKVRPQPSDDPFKRGRLDKAGKASDKKRIEKTEEADTEKERRKKFKQHFEEKPDSNETEKQLAANRTPSPYETKFYEKPSQPTLDGKQVLIDKEFKKALETEEKIPYYLENDTEENIVNNVDKTFKNLSIQKNEKNLRSIQAYEALEDKKYQIPEKNPKEETKDQNISLPSAPIDVPFEIQQRASEITDSLKVHLNVEIAPLFEQMIGRFIVMSVKEGIMQTEVVLNNPEMENSVFYGSKIILEKYSTAPDSFNIRLTGSPEAVIMFNNNISVLMNSFHRGNFSFRINDIIATHEIKEDQHLFRRKEKTSGGGPLEK
jgi:hypothetical protein